MQYMHFQKNDSRCTIAKAALRWVGFVNVSKILQLVTL